MRLGLSILNGAVLIPKPDCNTARANAPAYRHEHSETPGLIAAVCGTMMRGALLRKYCRDAKPMRKDRVATAVTGEFNAPTLYNRRACREAMRV